MLPLALWAAAPSAVTGLKYTGSAQTVAHAGSDWGQQYAYAIVQGTSTTKPNWYSASTSVPTATNAGTYTIWWAQRNGSAVNQSTWNSSNNHFTVTIDKAETTVSLYQVVKMWRGAAVWSDPSVDDLTASSYSLSAGSWSDIKGYLSWNQLQAVTDVGSYKYTLTAAEHPNYIIHIDGTAAELKVEPNDTRHWAQTATDGPNLQYNGSEQSLEPTDVPIFEDNDGYEAGTIEYSLDGSTWTAEYPKATDANVYTVTYRGVSNINHTEFTTTGSYNVEIEKIDATLAVTLDPTTYVYSPTLTVAPGYTSNNEETGGTVTYEYSFNGGFYTPTFTPEVGDWKVIAIQAETANYNETISAALDFTVTAPEIEEGWLTWTDNSDYDATDQLGTIEAGITILDGTDSTPLVLGTDYTIAIMKGGSAVTDVTNAGEYTFTFTGVGNYDGQFSKTFTMNKVAWVTVSDPVLAADWEYDGAEHALIDTEAAAAGYGTDVLDPAEIVYYLDDTATDLADLKVKNANEDPGYKVSFSINETENYLAVDKADLAPVFVTKKGLVITGASIAEVYKEPKWTFTKNQLFVVNDDDFVGDDKLLSADEQQTLVAGLITTTLTGVGDDILVTDVTPGLDRGAYTIHLADAAADVKNYKIKNLTDGGLNIEQAPNKFNNLEVADWTYGEAANAPVYDVDFKADDEPTFTYAVQGTTEFGTYEEIVNDQAGKYTVKAVVEQTNNYLKAEETADFEIKQAPLAITVKAQTKVYGEDDPELVLEADPAYQFTDDAETIGLTITRAEGEDVGTYAITAAVDADKAKNYDVTITNSTLEITKAPLAITIVDAEKVYGDADPEFTLDPAPEYQFEDNAETIGLVISREAGEDVGTYNITASYDTDKAKNYEITVTDATFEITAAELTIAVADATKVYGEEDPEFTLAEEPAYQNGDDATTIGLTYSREAGEDVGEYIISADATGAAASNYTITFTTGTLEITKAPLTLTAKALTKVYGEADPELILAEEPAYQWSDDAAAIGLTITREEGENVGTYTITPAATSENYEYTIVEADFEITPASLVYTLGNFTYPYTGEAYIPVEGESFVKTEGKLFFEDAYGKTFTFAWPDEAEVKDAGDYSFNKLQVNWAEGQSENYYIIFSETAKITVTPAEIAFTPAVAFEGLTYSGEAQTLIETPATAKFTDYEGNEIEFAIEYNVDGGEFSADLPEGTDAREYTVSTKVIADDNFVPVEAEDITVTIAPKAMTFDLAFEDAEWTYDGVAVEIEDLVAYDGEKALEKDVDYTLTITKDDEAFEGAMVNAGKYVYTYAGIEKSNYEGSSAEVTITINPASLEGIKVELSKTETDYNAEDQKPTYTLTYEPEGKPALTLVEGTDFEVAAEEKFINAGDYTFTFTGKGNYADENSADFTINKLELIAKVPAAKKTYDGTNAVENDEFGEFAYSGLIAGDHVDLGTATISDFVIVPEDAINVGEYELAIKDVAMFPEQQNYYVGSALPGTLTIEPAAPVTIAFTAAAKYSKEYASEDALEVVADDLMAAEGEFFDEFAEIADQLAISREEGEDVGTYDVELALAEGATFQNNYKEVKFAVGADKFEITPFATELKVSIADASVVYNGEVPTYDWAEDLSNMVVTNLPEGKDKSDIFTTLPTITIKDAAAAAGEYNLSIEGGESKNYKFKLLPGSYFTIEQFDLANATVTIPTQQAKVGQKAYTDEDGEGVINVTNFTIEDLPLATDIDGFVLEVGDGFIDGDGNIAAGADYKKGLVLVAADDDIAANYTGWENGEFTGNLIVEGGSELVLDDSETVSLSESAGAVNVTFTARGINSNSWNALVLPFDVTPSQLSDAFGYAAVDVLNENNDIEGEVHFNLITTGTIKAGTPFVFKPGEDTEGNLVANFTDVTFTGVQVKKEADYLANTTVTDAVGNKFIGTFEEITFTGAQYWYMSKGKWYDASEREVTLKPLRAYAEIANPKAGARFFFEEADGTVTAIDAISFNKANVEGMYNLSGMKVNNTNRKGVVIMNGKKVVK
jgi:hypothetical protein